MASHNNFVPMINGFRKEGVFIGERSGIYGFEGVLIYRATVVWNKSLFDIGIGKWVVR